ncbi:protein BRAWNIN isoform X1 [Scophthalmus maximus]|nr:protein BRAWNIN isoform X1 [Scophthalmus maximus]
MDETRRWRKCVKMPAGVSWSRYLRMLGASVLAMFAGAQVVHQYYLPDLSIPEVPPKPGELQTELLGYKVREEATAALQQLKAEQKVD